MNGYILLKDVHGTKKNTRAFEKLVNLMYTGTPYQNINILRGELIVAKQDDPNFNYQLWSDPNVLFYSMEDNVAPLSENEFLLLEGIRNPFDRFEAFALCVKDYPRQYLNLPVQDRDDNNVRKEMSEIQNINIKAMARDVDPASNNLGVGSLIQIPSSNQDTPRYGTIKWIGLLPNVRGQIAGIELVNNSYVLLL